MLSSSNQEMNTFIQKIFTDESIERKLDQEETMSVLRAVDRKFYDYGYKSKKAIDIYYKIEAISDKKAFNSYFRTLAMNLDKLEKGKCIFFINLIISDFVVYNKNLFLYCAKSKFIRELWCKNSSFSVVKCLLQQAKIFHKIKQTVKNPNYELYSKYFMKNNDDRVFKLGVGYINKYNIEEYLSLLNTVNQKYFLKRIKIINNHINLENHFDILLSLNYNNIETLKKIIKVYQNGKKLIDMNNLSITSSILNYDDMTKSKENYFALKKICIPVLFKTIQKYLIMKRKYIPFIHNVEMLSDIIQSGNISDFGKILEIVDKPYWWNRDNYQEKANLAKILNIHRKTILKANKNRTIVFMVYYSNHYPLYENPSDNIHFLENFMDLLRINRVKSFLRVCAKRLVKTNFMSFENRKLRLFKQIRNFTPKNIPVLSKGSNNYQVINQAYHNIKPPRMFNINKKYLSPYVTLKVDGVQVNRLPSMIKNKLSYTVKAEYIEIDGKDLYMVYDINIPDMTFMERVSFLRNKHPYHLPEYYEVSNIKELLRVLKQECLLELKWIKENKDEMSIWYPKAFIKYNGNLKELSKMILNNEFNPAYLNYPIDGLILSSCGVDSKIKPRKLHTIDIKYSKGKWYDNKDNEIKYTIINPYEVELNDDIIYRCYPETDDTYTVKDERYDKMIANSRNIINDIRKSYFQLEKNSYYEKNNKISKSSLKEVKHSRRNELVFLRGLDLSKDIGILDLCSGKGNILRMIPGHFYYTLIDKNPINKEERENVMIKKGDLNKYNLKKYRDDYWVCINGLWYIYDNFIKNVKMYKPTGLIFNTHSDNPSWRNNDSYLSCDGKMVRYKYGWCHSKEREERYLEGKRVSIELEKLGYRLIKYHKNNDDSLSSNFEFYYFRLG